VLSEAARRLTGGPPSAGFVETLQLQFDTDPFTRDTLIGVIADVAFGGRVPTHRPAGASWDRGLTWWAAAIAGTTPQDFEARAGPSARQQRLFGADDGQDDAPPSRPQNGPQSRRRRGTAERQMLVQALRELLAAAEGDMIPAGAVRQLLASLNESDTSAPGQ
jgi:hypothetical protein